MKKSLFREEVLKTNSENVFGAVLLTQSTTFNLLIGATVVITIVCLAFVYFGEFKEFHQAKGILESEDTLQLKTNLDGTIHYAVKAGQSVKSGDLIAQIKPSSSLSIISDSDFTNFNQELTFLQDNRLLTIERIAIQKKKIELEIDEEKKINSELEINQQKQLLLKLDFDIGILNNKIRQLENQINRIQGATNINATTSGLIENLQYLDGDEVKAGQSLAYIFPQESKLQAKIEAPSNLLRKLAIGQTALIKVENYPYQKFGTVTGRISDISINRNNNNIVVMLTLQNQYLQRDSMRFLLKPNMKINVDLDLGAKKIIDWFTRI